jgi:hypothetical protein
VVGMTLGTMCKEFFLFERGEIMARKPAPKKPETEKFPCMKCQRSLAENNFYINENELFTSKRSVICKKCLSDYIGAKDSIGYLDRVKMVLAILNKPLIWDLWISRDCDWQRYIPPLSSFPQYKGLTYADSDFMKSTQPIAYSTVETTSDGEIPQKNNSNSFTTEELYELQEFWGRGYSQDDYYFLTNEYQKLLNSYECDSYAMELLFQEAAQQRLTIKKRREKGDSVDKELKTLQDLLGSANIKPAQETGANAVEQATFGTLIKKYENEKPIPEPDDEWKDVDGIGNYIKIWFFGHLCKMLGIKNEYSDLYEQEVNKYRVEAPKFEVDEEGAT